MKVSLLARLQRYTCTTTSLVLIPLIATTTLPACAFSLRDHLRSQHDTRQSQIGPLLRNRSNPEPDLQSDQSLPECNGVVAAPTSGYGSQGPYKVVEESFPHPVWAGEEVHVFHPEGLNTPAPTIFFSHAFNATNPAIYSALIDNIVSQGYVLVYSPFIARGGSVGERYSMLRGGFQAAVQRYGQIIDTSRVGFIGHSFGGGATPAMAYYGLVQQGWGSKGAFLFMMAPWYATDLSLNQLQQLPKQTKVVLQVYEDDAINDHRIAIQLFNAFNVSEKQYMLLQSDKSYDSCALIANHGVPASVGRDGPRINALDYYGVFRMIDALADYTFNGQTAGQQLVFGNGTPEQTFMGDWPNGQAVKPLRIMSSPYPVHSQSTYQYPSSDEGQYVDPAMSPIEPENPS